MSKSPPGINTFIKDFSWFGCLDDSSAPKQNKLGNDVFPSPASDTGGGLWWDPRAAPDGAPGMDNI